MLKNCLKCGHANPNATGDELEACPNCSAIYSRVEAASATRPARPRRAEPQAQLPAQWREENIDEFASHLRSTSLYPVFRGLVGLVYFAFLVLAGLALLGGLVGAWSGSGMARAGVLFGGVFTALLFFIFAKLTREMSLMLADLADAAVRIASRDT